MRYCVIDGTTFVLPDQLDEARHNIDGREYARVLEVPYDTVEEAEAAEWCGERDTGARVYPFDDEDSADPARRFWIAPSTDADNRYSLGFDGNGFATMAEAIDAAVALNGLGGEWRCAIVVRDGDSSGFCATVTPGEGGAS